MTPTTSAEPRSGPVIRTHALTKTFTRHGQEVQAVRGLDLEVRAGELVAFLGPNGAGKSTTLRMLTTLLPPTSGTAEVAGWDVVGDSRGVRRRIGYVGQGNAAAHQQRGRDELVSQGRAHGLTRRDAVARAEELLDAFDLTEHAGRPVSTLSGGQRRRLDVAIGLVASPPLLFLDEPSTGLDPQNRINLQEQIRRLHTEVGTTVVLTTHYLEEADALAGRVVVIDHGVVIADDTAAALKSGLGDLIRLGFADEGTAVTAAERSASRLSGASVERTGLEITVRAPYAAEAAAGLVVDLADLGGGIQQLHVSSATLDDVFLDLTGRSLRESPSTSDNATIEGAAA